MRIRWRLTSELVVVKIIMFQNTRQISKAGQYGTWNNVLISGISNKILDQDLEEKVIQICNNSDMAETPMNIEGYQRLRLGRKVTKACQ